MPPKISALPFFVYPVSDMDRACTFYRDVLGLVEGDRWGDEWVEFGLTEPAPGPVLALATDMAGCTPGAQGGAVAIETPNFDAMVTHLKTHGVTFAMEPEKTSVCHFARFHDPDGNHLVLHRIHA
ncbi:VOC family protein [Synoicihabitans lomoniglobus]|uniref:VOC family protein n=1 Tax=Synoicihabitans lomoniglobus TaxID=2909285 RepID=A0AAF0CNQ2_9BACT|nr:VOC family protein [Opitutaceae bacterium LMO-M01]WED64821.1 VOC family protein [Opitutaceae bacterium LMO-M01]